MLFDYVLWIVKCLFQVTNKYFKINKQTKQLNIKMLDIKWINQSMDKQTNKRMNE